MIFASSLLPHRHRHKHRHRPRPTTATAPPPPPSLLSQTRTHTNTNSNVTTKHEHSNGGTPVSTEGFRFLRLTSCAMLDAMAPRKRRHRPRRALHPHEQLTVRLELAVALHHSAQHHRLVMKGAIGGGVSRDALRSTGTEAASTGRCGQRDTGVDHEYMQFSSLGPQVNVQDLPEVQVDERVPQALVPQLVAQLVGSTMSGRTFQAGSLP